MKLMKLMKTMMAVAAFALAIGNTIAGEPGPMGKPTAADEAAREATPSLEERVKGLEKKLQTLESIPLIAMALNARGDATPAPTRQADAPLELVDWNYHFKSAEHSFDYRHVFNYWLKNRTGKEIKMVDAILSFTDLLGEKLIAIQLDQDHVYPAGVPSLCSGEWRVNDFENGQTRLVTMKRDDIKAVLVVRKVVFADNSIWDSSAK